MTVWHAIGQQLQHPQGCVGHVVGHAMHRLNSKPNHLAIASLAIRPTDHILELGYGPGQAVAEMARQVTTGKIYGLDASPAMLMQAVRRNRRAIAAGKVSLELGEFSPLPMADNTLDKILAVNVVYFWQDAPAILAECHRALRPGGSIAIYATDASTMRQWKFAGEDTHRHYTGEDLRAALLQGGFAGDQVWVEPVTLPAGIRGLVATAQKSSTPVLPT